MFGSRFKDINFKGDIFGGVTTAIISLPLALAFGVASGAGAEAGLWGAIMVGLFASLFGGSNTLISEPTGPMTVIMGGVTRGLLVGAIVTCVSLLFVDLQVEHWGIIVATVFMTSVVFALGGLINAVYAKTFDDISIIPTFVLTPLTYLGGVFYSISLLPEFWQGVSKINPIVYMLLSSRQWYERRLGIHRLLHLQCILQRLCAYHLFQQGSFWRI